MNNSEIDSYCKAEKVVEDFLDKFNLLGDEDSQMEAAAEFKNYGPIVFNALLCMILNERDQLHELKCDAEETHRVMGIISKAMKNFNQE